MNNLHTYLLTPHGFKLHLEAKVIPGQTECGLWRYPLSKVAATFPAERALLCEKCRAQIQQRHGLT